ncbi:flagellar hook protein FlgE [Tistrella mobilis]
MSFGLYGSLYSGVSGLGAQSTAMGVISDNIANVNTVGYKAKNTNFQTLVTDSGSKSFYAPGGVRASVQQLIDQQGLVQGTTSGLDVAISGDGFFVVEGKATGTNEVLYTRAGSFVPDEQGYLRNAAGFYLQGWPLDSAGRLPGEAGNVTNTTSSADISSLETVNVGQISGTAVATTEMTVAVNLNTNETTYTGATSTSAPTSGVSTSDDLIAAGVVTAGDTITLSDGVNTVTFTAGTGAGQFSTLAELADLVEGTGNFVAELGGTATAGTISISAYDPRRPLTVSGAAATGALSLDVTASPATYDAANSALNMSSGAVASDFSRSVRVYDGQGRGHDLMVNFLKVGNNEWAVEINAVDKNDIITTAPTPAGQIAAGVVTFNSDGTLNTVSPSLTNALHIDWAAGAGSSDITPDWGTAGPLGTGQADGLRQYAGDYEVRDLSQNGASSGELTEVKIDADGFVVASFSNGEQKQLYKLPIATFASPQNLQERTGNVFAQTDKSGNFNLRESGQSGAGLISPSSLEASNVDLASEFTDMIITQRAYSASSKIITTADEMLQEIINTKR